MNKNKLTIRHLLIATTLIAVSVSLTIFDRFASILTLFAVYLGVVAVWHTAAINVAKSQTVFDSLQNGLLPTLLMMFALPEILPPEYSNNGWFGQAILMLGLLFTVAILYAIVDRVVNQE